MSKCNFMTGIDKIFQVPVIVVFTKSDRYDQFKHDIKMDNSKPFSIACRNTWD